MFTSGIHKAFTVAMFNEMPRRDQDSVMQTLYDEGYSGKDIGKFLNKPAQTVYGRIDASRGRGPTLKPA